MTQLRIKTTLISFAGKRSNKNQTSQRYSIEAGAMLQL